MRNKIITVVAIFVVFLLATSVLFNVLKKEDNNGLTKVKVAEVAHSIFYAPQYVAISEGFFEEVGIEVDLTLIPGADKVTASILSGDMDIAFCGSEATIYVYNGGEKDYLKTFAQLTQKDGTFLVSRKMIDNFSLEDLKGKYVIGGRINGMPEMTFEWALREAGIDPKKDLTIDTSIEFAAMSGAFISGIGDFVTLFEPTALEVEQQGYGYVVASIGELGGVVPYTSYSARISYIKENEELIENFTKAVQKGLDFVHENDSETIAKSILDFFPDTALNDLTDAVDRYKRQDTWPKATTFTEESFNHLQKIMIASGAIETPVNYSELIYSKD